MTSTSGTSVVPEFNDNYVAETDRRFLNCKVADDNILNLFGVPLCCADFIRMVDSEPDHSGRGQYELYHFLQTTTMSNQGTTADPYIRAITDVKGIIVYRCAEKAPVIVCKSLPYVPEIPVSKISTIDVPGENIRYVHAVEGTLMRVWIDFNGVWRISTHRKINGRNGRWGSITFGEAFDQTFGSDFSNLNSDYVYWFVVSHPKNRLIYSVSNASITLIGLWHRPSNCAVPIPLSLCGESTTSTPSTPSSVGYPEGLKQVSYLAKTVDDLVKVVSDNHCNVIVTDPTGKWPVKIVTDEYLEKKDARGNCPNLVDRYLQLMFPGNLEMRNNDMLKVFVTTYSDEKVYRDLFQNVNRDVNSLIYRLHRSYMNRFVHKQVKQLPKGEFILLIKMHQWHCDTKNRVTLDVVRDFVFDTPYYYLKPLLSNRNW